MFNPQFIGGGVICNFIVTTFNWLRLCWCNVRSEIKKQFLETVVFNYTYLNITAFKWWRYYIVLESLNAFERKCNYLVCNVEMEGGNTILEAVKHSFAIMGSDPDGGIGGSVWGQYQGNI